MKKSLFLYHLSLVASAIISAASILSVEKISSVYETSPNFVSSKYSELSHVSSENQIISSTFSTANVVKTTSAKQFSSQVYETDNVYYVDYSGASHNDLYSIMRYTSGGQNFYYAHETGGFRGLSSLVEGDFFTVGGIKYQVKKIELLDFYTTASNMSRIKSSDYGLYDGSFMTCYGQKDWFKNNSGTVQYTSAYRFIVYADYA